ncbi:MAG: two-component system response regulator [Roseiflexaceae bacterium]
MANLIGIIKSSTAPRRTAAWVTAALDIDARRPRVLIASGNLDAAQRLAEVLRESDYEIVIATDRPLALRLAVWQLPELLILDAQLAGDDGVALCASLKRDRRTRSIAIIIMAGVYDLQEHRCCIEAGADDYLVWADPALMPTRIRALLRAKQHQEQERIERIAQALGCVVEAKNGASAAQLQSLSCCAVPC